LSYKEDSGTLSVEIKFNHIKDTNLAKATFHL